MSPHIPFERIAMAALAQCERLLREWFPAGKVSGREFKVGDIQGNPGESLSINMASGLWCDFATNQRGHDLIDLFAAKRGTDRVAAARALGSVLGIPSSGHAPLSARAKIDAVEWKSMIPPPAGTARPGSVLSGFDRVYEYTDAQDRVTHYVGRIEACDGRRKQFVPITYGALDGRLGWHRKHPKAPRPLYGLNRLSTALDAPVLLCEGEKAADAAQSMFPDHACLSWPGGAGAVAQADFAPLAERSVVVWPDNDVPGLTAAAEIQKRLPHAYVLRVDDLGEGHDAADVFPEDPDAWLSERLMPAGARKPGGASIDPMPDLRPNSCGVSSATNLLDGAEERPATYSDEALALRFTGKHAGTLRYVAAWGRWLIWDGNLWRFDDTMLAFDLSRAVCRQASAECNNPRVSAAIASAKTVAAVERLAKADRRHAATVEQWDSDPWLLNTPGGVVDLRTGSRMHRHPELHMTKITAVAPGGECPTWHRFLSRITGSDGELHDFLQRVAGYALTGITNEHALFFAYGTGGNGKGVFLNTVTGILSGYATVAPMETFTASQSDRHPTDLAMLRGARLVASQETEEGRQWAESKIKALTGGDPITARFMRQDFFTFTPSFKLFIAGNHKPGLNRVDEAIRRRLHLIPFNQTIQAAERDPELPEKLKAEWPGILAWAIDGCLQWQRVGLQPPAAVREATDEYLGAEDALAIWITERCRHVGYGGTEATRLFADWSAWARAAGEIVGSQKRFSQALQAKGYKKDQSARHATFVGIALDFPRPWTETGDERA